MNNILFISNSALIVVLKLTAIPIALATIVGIIVGIFQTVMQIQEQTLAFGLKMLTVIVSMLVLIEWFSDVLMNFTANVFYMAFR